MLLADITHVYTPNRGFLINYPKHTENENHKLLKYYSPLVTDKTSPVFSDSIITVSPPTVPDSGK